MTIDWSAGIDRPHRASGGVFEPSLLPEASKEQLCRDLLAEFGVTSISQRGNELTHCCAMPWHEEKHPSASLNFSKLTYKCLGCNSSGGLLWLIGAVRGVDTREAKDWVNGKTGVIGGGEFDLKAMLDLFDAIENQQKRATAPLPKFSTLVLKPWRVIHPWLLDPPPLGRGIPEQNVIDLNIGYDPKAKIKVGDSYVESHRIIFPHFWKGDLVGWQSRRLWNDGTPKYKSTSDFPRDRTLYGFDAKRRRAVWVESPMTVARHVHHLPMEATFGSAVTEQQVDLLAQHDTVILWPDNDEAGWRAVEGTYDNKGKLEHLGVAEQLEAYSTVLVVDSPWAADGADMDDETAQALVDSAVPYALWKRPEALLCWVCKKSHPNEPCKGGE